MSLALMIGVGVWGYRLLVRDVSGVPVVRALDGPMRVQPENPGGRPADHQGLAVNDVAASGSAAAPADRLVLAPKPVRLMAEDEPTQGNVPIQASARAPGASAGAIANPEVAALVEQLTDGVEPLLGDEPEPETPVVAGPESELLTDEAADDETEETARDDPADPTEPTVEIVTGPGVARSIHPRVRPKRTDGPASGEVVVTASAEADVLDVDPDALPAGTRLAQLGAFDSADVARAAWDRLNGRFVDYMDGKQRVIQKASSGGRTFYRLRAMGFQDLSDARRFCAVLVAENADCIPVTTR